MHHDIPDLVIGLIGIAELPGLPLPYELLGAHAEHALRFFLEQGPALLDAQLAYLRHAWPPWSCLRYHHTRSQRAGERLLANIVAWRPCRRKDGLPALGMRNLADSKE